MVMICVETPVRFFSGNSIVWAKEDPSSLPTPPRDPLKDLPADMDSLKNPFTQKLPLPKRPEIETEIEPERPETAQPTPPPVEPPPMQAAVNPPAVAISGLIWGTDHPQAIVNKKIVGVGDKIEDWAITAINEQGIEISWKGIKRFIANKFDHKP